MNVDRGYVKNLYKKPNSVSGSSVQPRLHSLQRQPDSLLARVLPAGAGPGHLLHFARDVKESDLDENIGRLMQRVRESMGLNEEKSNQGNQDEEEEEKPPIAVSEKVLERVKNQNLNEQRR